MRTLLEAAVGEPNIHAVDAGRIAQALFGDSIAVNVFMLGYAWQKGLLPVGARRRSIRQSRSTAQQLSRTRPRFSGAGEPHTIVRR